MTIGVAGGEEGLRAARGVCGGLSWARVGFWDVVLRSLVFAEHWRRCVSAL